MNKKRIETLKNAGLDADRYLSLRIDKSQIPEGAEVVFQVRDRKTGEVMTMPTENMLDRYFGKNSRFYQKVMRDGHVFNPYIHRRFLPAQFRRNMRCAGTLGIRDYVRTSYGWNYVVRFLSEESWKLALLEKRDREAFMERSRFFPLPDMKSILYSYASEVIRVLDEAAKEPHRLGYGKQKTTYYLAKGIGSIQKEHLRPMKYRFSKFQESVLACCSYAQLAGYLERFDFAKLDRAVPICDTFIDRFLQSGAFYTLKHMVMFENLSLGSVDVTENLEKLYEYPLRNLMGLFCQYDK